MNREEGGCVRGKSQTTEKNNLTSTSTSTKDTLKSILEALAVLTNLIQVTRQDTVLFLAGEARPEYLIDGRNAKVQTVD